MAEILSTASLVSFIVSGASLALTAFIWFYFKIPSVIGYLSGRISRKSIAKLRTDSGKDASASYRPSRTNLFRGMLTNSMGVDGKSSGQRSDETELLADSAASAAPRGDETAPLNSGTAPLYSGAGNREDDDTPALETAALDGTHEPADTEDTGLLPQGINARSGKIKITMLDEIIMIHTDEEID